MPKNAQNRTSIMATPFPSWGHECSSARYPAAVHGAGYHYTRSPRGSTGKSVPLEDVGCSLSAPSPGLNALGGLLVPSPFLIRLQNEPGHHGRPSIRIGGNHRKVARIGVAACPSRSSGRSSRECRVFPLASRACTEIYYIFESDSISWNPKKDAIRRRHTETTKCTPRRISCPGNRMIVPDPGLFPVPRPLAPPSPK